MDSTKKLISIRILKEHWGKGCFEAMQNGEPARAALIPMIRRVAALPEEDRKMALVAKEAISKSESCKRNYVQSTTMNERSSVLDLGHWNAKPCLLEMGIFSLSNVECFGTRETSSNSQILQSFANNLSCKSYASVFLCQYSYHPQPTSQQETYHDLTEVQTYHHPYLNIIKKGAMI